MNRQTTLYYDGYCNLCSTWIKIIKRADRKKFIVFIQLQSEKGLLAQKKIETLGQKLDTLIYKKEGVFYINSDAVIYCLSDVGGLWKVLKLFRWIPQSFRDLIYKTIARHRYTFFGKVDSCSNVS